MITVGIDVGGARKGFHAVALSGGTYLGQLRSLDALELARWCRDTLQALVIAIDAPCRWRTGGRLRPCERALMRQGIRCFATPTRENAVGHPSGYYDWMLRGEALYQALEPSHPLCGGLPLQGRRCCFETFPHAITWQLRGGAADAACKYQQRRALLEQAGIDPAPLSSIDWIDAGLCALAAHRAASGGDCLSYGEADSGLILVPAHLAVDLTPLPERLPMASFRSFNRCAARSPPAGRAWCLPPSANASSSGPPPGWNGSSRAMAASASSPSPWIRCWPAS
jgi:predicted nuclease with RNAse H fold